MCDCNEGKIYQIGMGCCTPVLGPIENYYTKGQVDELIENVEVSACCITEEEVDEKIAEAISGITPCDLSDYYTKEESDAKYLTEHQHLKTLNGESLVGEGNIVISGDTDLTNYVTFDDMAEYVGDVYTKQEVNNLFVTKQYFNSNTISRDVFITTIYNLNQEINSLKAAISACCGSSGETEYRWIVVPNDYTCSGTTKMTKEKQESSTDGINWTDTGQYRTGSTVLEYNSVDCGYAPVTTYKVEMRYNDGTEDDRECDGSSNLKWLHPSNWENISGVTVGSCINEIGNLCFNGFSGLTSVSLPNTVTKIDKMAFYACIALPSITIPNGVTHIGSQAFSHNISLTSITIPSGVTILEYATFLECESLANVELPSNLVTIENNVFEGCAFSSITIPSTVKVIGEFAFSYNSNLDTVTCLATTPPTLQNNNIFIGSNSLTVIYVPANSVDAYKAATGWSYYADIIQPIQ